MVLPFWEGPEPAATFAPIPTLDFQGKASETLLLYPEKGRTCLLGLGKKEKGGKEQVRRAYAEAAKVAMGKKVKRLTLLVPAGEEVAAAEGVLLANYAYSKKEKKPFLLEECRWIGVSSSDSLKQVQTIASGVYFVRDLVNGNADDVTPEMLAETALSFDKKFAVKVLGQKELEREKMGLLLAVGRASIHESRLVTVSYKGNPTSSEHIVLVGKGVTFDTGGLSLKTNENMLTMKCDMSGAATVLGAVRVAGELGLKVNVTAVMPLVENAIGSKSYKPGDVYISASGKSVEINNTDGEGRLILADAITYVQRHLKPTCLIDVASLTGAAVVALGEEIAGLFTDNDELSDALLSASKETGEPLWRLPLYSDYLETLKSEIADLVNTAGREAGATKAALFLKEFVGTVPWAHIDFAGPCYLSKPKRYYPTQATGFGLRLLIAFLEKKSQ